MISVRSFGAVAVVASAASVAFAAFCAFGVSVAHADEECPLGSVQKSESGETWCEPTICDDDTQCPTGSLCRPVPLCVEIGVLPQAPGTKSDAGQRLLVRQRCGADKSCPQRTTCSEKGRCITRAQAERANLLTVPSASASGSAGTPAAGSTGTPKKACGCDVPGRSTGNVGGVGLALLSLAVIASRRRSRQPADRR